MCWRHELVFDVCDDLCILFFIHQKDTHSYRDFQSSSSDLLHTTPSTWKIVGHTRASTSCLVPSPLMVQLVHTMRCDAHVSSLKTAPPDDSTELGNQWEPHSTGDNYTNHTHSGYVWILYLDFRGWTVWPPPIIAWIILLNRLEHVSLWNNERSSTSSRSGRLKIGYFELSPLNRCNFWPNP